MFFSFINCVIVVVGFILKLQIYLCYVVADNTCETVDLPMLFDGICEIAYLPMS